MILLLKEISELAIANNELEFTAEQKRLEWLGCAAAIEKEIKAAEERLQVSLPEDYKNFLLITNGFAASTVVDPSFLPVSKIDFLKNIHPDLIEVWSEEILIDVGRELARSILIGGLYEEQQFLIIPPLNNNEGWKYWRFASWYPGEESVENLKDHFNKILDFLKDPDTTY